jgi:hypothetical protein
MMFYLTLPFDSVQGPVTSIPRFKSGDATEIVIRCSIEKEIISSSLSGVEGHGIKHKRVKL